MIILSLVLLMANPTNVYDITFQKRHSEKEVIQALSEWQVLQAKRHDSGQQRWEVVIQSKDTRFKVRDAIKKLPGVRRVTLLPPAHDQKR